MAFRRKCKNASKNKKLHLMPFSRHGHFHPILILLEKIVKLTRQHASTTVCFFSVVYLTLPSPSCKELHQSFEICLWKRGHSQKRVRFRVKTSLFPYYFEVLPSLSKVIVFFYVTFYSMMYFRRLLLLSCFYGSSQYFFKVKITFKRVNFIKK